MDQMYQVGGVRKKMYQWKDFTLFILAP